MKALSDGPVDRGQVPAIMQRDAAVAARLVDDLVTEGLCCRAGSILTLP